MDYKIKPFETIKDEGIIERNLTGWEFPIAKEVCYRVDRDNKGIFKFMAPPGANVKASKDGIVFLINKNNHSKWSTGNRVILDHGEGIYTRYENLSLQHFDDFEIKEGKRVKQDQIIGVVGLPSNLFFNGFVYIKETEDSIMKQKIIPVKFDEEELINKPLSYKEIANYNIANSRS